MRRAFWTQAMDSLPPDERLRFAGHFAAVERCDDSITMLLDAGAAVLRVLGASCRSLAAGLRITARVLDFTAQRFGA